MAEVTPIESYEKLLSTSRACALQIPTNLARTYFKNNKKRKISMDVRRDYRFHSEVSLS